MDLFFVGMHHPNDAGRVPLACVSANALRSRKSRFSAPVGGWMLDSGAFTILNKYGFYPTSPNEYATEAERWRLLVPGLRIVVAQDYMCEPFVLAKTGLTVAEHQRLTIERYDSLLVAWVLVGDASVPIMPVIQGWTPDDYVTHLRAYGTRLAFGAWVGVGSVCKRQGDPAAIYAVLVAIKNERSDLRLHGFGVKITALKEARIRALLYSADSMAWSFSARMQGRDANAWSEAFAYHERVASLLALDIPVKVNNLLRTNTLSTGGPDVAKLTFSIETDDKDEMAGYMAALFAPTDEVEPSSPEATEAPKRRGRPPKSDGANGVVSTAAASPAVSSVDLSGAATEAESSDPMDAAIDADPISMDDVKTAMAAAIGKVQAPTVLKAMKVIQADATNTASIKPQHYAAMIAAFETLAA